MTTEELIAEMRKPEHDATLVLQAAGLNWMYRCAPQVEYSVLIGRAAEGLPRVSVPIIPSSRNASA